MNTRQNSILVERKGGTYYTGPLEPAKRALLDEYGDSITVHYNDENGVWQVAEHRGCPAGDLNPNQWGMGKTQEEAWRYLIGNEFGPLDDTYEAEDYEAHQRSMLGLPPLEAS